MSFNDRELNRFQSGISTRPSTDIFNSLRYPDPTIYMTFYEEWFDYDSAGITADTDPNWTGVQGGNGSVADVNGTPQAIGGVVQINSGALGGSGFEILKRNNFFSFELGLKAFIKFRLSLPNLGNGIDSEIAVGLGSAGFEFGDYENGIFWTKFGGSDNFGLGWRNNWAESQPEGQMDLENIPDVTEDGTFFELGIFWDGINSIWAAFDDATLERATVETGVTTDALPIGTPLAPSMYINNDDNAPFGLVNIDSVFTAVERSS